jgi:hypothetical protein
MAAQSPSPDAVSEGTIDIGLMMIFASYRWENIGDDQVWDEDLRLARLAPGPGFDVL